MHRPLTAAALVAAFATAAHAQGPLQRVDQALETAGQNIRHNVEGAVARTQITAQEKEILSRVESRIAWDKQMAGTAIRFTVQADGSVVLKGSVPHEAAKRRAFDLVENTTGVTAVVDELVLAKDVKVIKPAPVIVAPPVEAEVVAPASTVVVPPPKEVVVPRGTMVIEKD